METLLRDIRYGLRMLAKAPAVTAITVLILALGIGSNAAIFSLANAFFVRPLPVQSAERLTVLVTRQKGNSGYGGFSYPDLLDYRAGTPSFSGLLAYQIGLVGLTVDGRSEQMVVSYVSGNYFPALGIKPLMGHFIDGQTAETQTAVPQVVLGYSYWKKRFSGDPSIVGRQVKVDGRQAQVAGIAPQSFGGLNSMVEMQGYLPLGLVSIDPDSAEFRTNRNQRDLQVLGYLKPGVNLNQAQANIDVVAKQLATQYPVSNRSVTASAFPERLARPEPQEGGGLVLVALLFLMLSGLVLLLACANVVTIMLVRTIGRRRELVIRAALGAGRGRLIRQWITEGALLGLIGGVLGVTFGAGAASLVSSIRIESVIPVRVDFNFDWRVYVFAFGVALLSGILVGLLPAFAISRGNLTSILREGGRGLVGGRSRLRSSLVAAQITGSFLLLVVAGLFVRSLRSAERIPLGYEHSHVLTISMDPHLIGDEAAQSEQFYLALISAVRSLPGVQSVSSSFSVPMGYYNDSEKVYINGQDTDAKSVPQINFNSVDPAFFETLRIPLMRGRMLLPTDQQKSPKVAVINQTMANRFWPGEEAVGKRFRVANPTSPLIEVVGVAANGKYLSPIEKPRPYFYVPIAQNFRSLRTLEIRTAVNPDALSTDVLRQVHGLRPEMPVFDVRTMDRGLEGGNGFLVFRLGAALAGGLGLLGLTLTLAGVYGVVSHSATQRTQEVAVRLALGAQPKEILTMFLKQVMKLAALGIVIGLPLTVLASSAISNLFVGGSTVDPLVYGLVGGLLVLTTLAAGTIPAARVLRISPLTSLRTE